MGFGWPIANKDGLIVDLGTSLSNSSGIQLPSITQYSKGSWVTISGSTPYDFTALYVQFSTAWAAGTAFALDIATGGIGAETPIISNIVLTHALAGGANFRLPCFIPAGTRIAARVASNAANDAGPMIQVHGVGGGFDSFPASLYDTFNTTLNGLPMGVQLDPGGTDNVKSGFVALGTTAFATRAFFLTFDNQGSSPAGSSTTKNDGPNYLIDVAIGAAGSEQIVIPNIFVYKSFNLDLVGGFQADSQCFPPVTDLFWIPMTGNTRVSARVQSTNTANGTPDRLIGVSLYTLRV